MLHPKILDKDKTALVVVDFQEAFRSPINDFAQIAARISIAVRGFQILNLPIIITEQYPKGLGKTAEEILFSLPLDFEFVEKSAFSSCGASSFMEKLRATGASQIVLCGLETHVCVNQTAHDLINETFEVHLLTDCVSSRFSIDKETALRKMQMNGVVSSTVEMALFELMRDSKHEQFKEIQNLIK
ncbi:MAG: isochorismatase family protein [Acidobacteria bacterium]|nr:isochorismatase family protein [Acidobacteriota bacterium]